MADWLFAEGYKPEPYWWERSPRPAPDEITLPAKADVVIIGSGYTGLHAALQTARGGRDTVVIDAEAAGWGCSSRNGGQVGTSLKPSYDDLAAKHGPQLAHDILREGHDSLEWIGEFIEREGIDCSLSRCGRFHAAHTPKKYEELARSIENQPKGLETGSHLVPRAEQHREIGTDFYHGGVVHPRHVSVDPGAYHLGLLRLAREAGVTIVPFCKAEGISGTRGAFEVQTSKGRTTARDVIVATSGYTGRLTPWQQRRIIPIGSYMLATEPLETETIDRLMPKGRVFSDTRKLVVYYRTCPERRRILFGGRVSLNETDPTSAAPALHGLMARRFPELAKTPITHAWMGFVGYTFAQLPHLGVRDGIHYSMGYCGAGVGLSSYFGMRIGQQLLGLAEGDSPLCRLRFETRPYYWGTPWFMAPAVRYYRWQDERVA